MQQRTISHILYKYLHQQQLEEVILSQSLFLLAMEVTTNVVGLVLQKLIVNIIINPGTVPAIPTLLSVERFSAVSARVNWRPLTPDEARGLLTQLEIGYEPVQSKDCTSFYPRDSQVVYLTERLFEQNSATLSDLKPNTEYCIVIKVSTSAGESGYSNSILLPCEYYTIITCTVKMVTIITLTVSRRVPFQVRFPLPDGGDCSLFIVS